MLRHRKIRKELERLGELSSADIAQKLIDLGITGTRGHYSACVLVEYFKLVDDKHDITISKSDDTYETDYMTYNISVNGRKYPMSDNLGNFIFFFDTGYYPELDNGKPKPNPDNFLW